MDEVLVNLTVSKCKRKSIVSKTAYEPKSIDNEHISKLCFSETLDIVNQKGEVLGEFVGKIHTCDLNTNSSSLMVNLNSKSVDENGQEILMSVITKTTGNFKSFEEKWSQWNASKMARQTLLVSKKSSKVPFQIYTCLDNGGFIDRTNNINRNSIKNLLTEGMHYAFLRYLATIGFNGSITNKMAVTVNGQLCKTTYECSLNEKYKINGVKIPVVTIKRIIHNENSQKSSANQMITILTRSGYILNHSWGDTINNQMVIKRSMRVTKHGRVHIDPILYLKNNWDQDIRLKSIYLDKASKVERDFKNYIRNNQKVKALITDYLKDILLFKPDDVLQFSIDYFN